MKHIKGLIIFFIIVLVILAIVLLGFILQKRGTIQEIQEATPEPVMEEVDSSMQEIDTYNRYMAVDKTLRTYFANIGYKSSKIIYHLLDEEVINSQSITEENVFEKVMPIQNQQPIVKIDSVEMQDDFDYPIFFVQGTVYDVPYVIDMTDEFNMDIDYRQVNESDVQKREYYLILRVDLENITYSIEEINQARYQNIRNGREVIEPKAIQSNQYNKFSGYTNVTDEEICTLLMDDYEMDILLNASRAYQKLDPNYQANRFTSETEYRTYLANRKNDAGMLKLDQYQTTTTEEYTQYICLDRAGNYYIFRVTSPTDYTLILDTYTIDLPEVVSQYQQADTAGKVQLNLIKLFTAINEGNYRYAYQKLNQTFRTENFPTLTDFENYVKETFYTKNEIGVSNFANYDYIYRYEVTIRNEEQPSAAYVVKKTFSMSLGEGTNFEYSFNK